MTKKELQDKFYYVQVRDKYEVLKAAEILEKIDVTVFADDAAKLKFLNTSTTKNAYMIKDNDGWRIQSHS